MGASTTFLYMNSRIYLFLLRIVEVIIGFRVVDAGGSVSAFLGRKHVHVMTR